MRVRSPKIILDTLKQIYCATLLLHLLPLQRESWITCNEVTGGPFGGLLETAAALVTTGSACLLSAVGGFVAKFCRISAIEALPGLPLCAVFKCRTKVSCLANFLLQQGQSIGFICRWIDLRCRLRSPDR